MSSDYTKVHYYLDLYFRDFVPFVLSFLLRLGKIFWCTQRDKQNEFSHLFKLGLSCKFFYRVTPDSQSLF